LCQRTSTGCIVGTLRVRPGSLWRVALLRTEGLRRRPTLDGHSDRRIELIESARASREEDCQSSKQNSLVHLHRESAVYPETLADRTSEALDEINEAEALAERFENRYWSAELYRLRGVFLAAMGAEGTQIKTSFSEAIRIAKEQKSVSLQKRAEATYAEYRRQKASASGGRGYRLPL
jgi:hypothetical protein